MTSEEIDGVKGTPGLQFRYQSADAGGVTELEPAFHLVGLDPSVHNCNGTKIGIAFSVLHETGGDAWVHFKKPLAGSFCDGGLWFCGGGGSYFMDTGRVLNSAQNRRMAQGYILDRDNSGLVQSAADAALRTTTTLVLGHRNALGTDNALPIWLCDGGWCSYCSRVNGIIASNGVSVAANMTTATDGFSGTGADNNQGVKPQVFVGAAAGSTNEFAGTLFIAGGANAYGVDAHLTAGKGGCAVFGGKLTAYGPVIVDGEGDVVLTNLSNFISNFSDVFIHSGRLVALNGVKSIGDRSVSLGETVTGETTVRAVITGRRDDVKWTPLNPTTEKVTTSSGYEATWNVCDGYTVSQLPVVDGVTLKAGDRLLVASLDYLYGYDGAGTDGGSYMLGNGVYEVQPDGLTLRVLPPFDGGGVPYGYRIRVTEGEKYAGKAFYASAHTNRFPESYGNYRPGNRYSLPLLDEAKAQPDVGFLIGNYTFPNWIKVNDNRSSGKSEIGTYEPGEDAMTSGRIWVYKDTVTLSAVKDSKLTIAGGIINYGVEASIVKEGPGTVKLNAGWDLQMAGGLTLREGTLEIGAEFFVSKTTFDYEMTDGVTGLISTEGDRSLDGRTFNLTGFGRQRQNKRIVLLRTTGTLSGTPTVTGLTDDHWSVAVEGSELVACYKKRGIVIYVK